VFERNINSDTGLHLTAKTDKLLKITKFLLQKGSEVETMNL